MFAFRPSALNERVYFYKHEFNIKKASSFLAKKPQFFVIDPGSETKIIKNKSKVGKLTVLKPSISYKELKDRLPKYAPEDLYYDRNTYKDPNSALKTMNFRESFRYKNFLNQQLAFDIDPENIDCNHKNHLSFCPKCLIEVKKQATEMINKLQDIGFNKIKPVYSGRGFHIHVFDEKAYNLSIGERSAINKKLKEFAIDPWVSKGRIRLIRLPYSLNSIVSRIVLPLRIKEIKRFNPLTDNRTIPRFLKSKIKEFKLFKI